MFCPLFYQHLATSDPVTQTKAICLKHDCAWWHNHSAMCTILHLQQLVDIEKNLYTIGAKQGG